MKGAKSKSASDSKLSVRQGGAAKGGRKAKEAAKDPNKPKRPVSAFFVFMEEFRQEFKEKNPDNRAVSVVGKAGGEKWKSMTAEEKAPYIAKAWTRKTEYEKALNAYNNGEEMDVNESENPKAVAEEEQPEKSVSEVQDGEGSDEDGPDRNLGNSENVTGMTNGRTKLRPFHGSGSGCGNLR